MGGRIEVASEHGKGSTFRFFIETRTSKTQTRIHDRPQSGSSNGGSTTRSRPALKKRNTGKGSMASGPKPHVLIVEDNLINQTVLMRQLKHVGLTTEGKHCSSRFLEMRYGGRKLIFQLPIMDWKRLKRFEKSPKRMVRLRDKLLIVSLWISRCLVYPMIILPPGIS